MSAENDGKYGQVTTERGKFHPDEPLFILRGQDPVAPFAILAYADLCEQRGCRPDHVAAVIVQALRMTEWQEAHPELVKARPEAEVER